MSSNASYPNKNLPESYQRCPPIKERYTTRSTQAHCFVPHDPWTERSDIDISPLSVMSHFKLLMKMLSCSTSHSREPQNQLVPVVMYYTSDIIWYPFFLSKGPVNNCVSERVKSFKIGQANTITAIVQKLWKRGIGSILDQFSHKTSIWLLGIMTPLYGKLWYH